MSAEVTALSLSELIPGKFMFSEKKHRTWDFMDKKTGKNRTGGQTYVELYYEKPLQKLCFVIENVKSFSGIQTTDNFKRGFMSVSLTKAQSDAIRAAVDAPIFQLAFQCRGDLVKNGKKMVQSAEMKFMFNGVVQDGKEKKDKSGQPLGGNWDDSITGNIHMKKKDNQPVVDPNECEIVDLEGRPYAWSALDGKPIKELFCEVEKVTFDDKIRVHCVFRSIVPEAKAGVKYVSRRRLEQKPGEHAAEGDGEHKVDASGSAADGAPAAAAAAAAGAAPSAPPSSAVAKPDDSKGGASKTEHGKRPRDS